MTGTFVRRLATTLTQNGTIRHWVLREPAGGFDLRGEKQLDWGWAMAKVASLSGTALDIGCGHSPVPAALHAAGFATTAIDLQPDQPFDLPGLEIISDDFLHRNFPAKSYDLVVLCSTVEHMGLQGRYDSAEAKDADLACMQKVLTLLRPSGRLILTIPLGHDYVLGSWHRVYGPQRFPRLIAGFEVVDARAFKRSAGRWQATSVDDALDHPRTPQRYAVGEFVLRPANAGTLDKTQ
jgi:SAM-dependent methyltransferase